MASLVGPLYLGLDLSTQQLKATVIDDALQVVYEQNVSFDKDLPHYKTVGGVHKHEDGVTVTAPVMMWIESLDILFERMKLFGFPFHQIRSVSGSGQQHGSVYWAKGSLAILKELSPKETLAAQLNNAFSIQECPIWMDASTEEQCLERHKAFGGALEVAKLTGSAAHCRFTGNQIRKIFQRNRAAYDGCERISLVSSFMASLLLAGYAPIDVADGSGMNLLNIEKQRWDRKSLDVTAPGLAERLGNPVKGGQILGTVSAYMRDRYKFSSHCNIIAFTGDNPATFAAMRLAPGDIAMSLGTSDTVLLALPPPPIPQEESTVMCSCVHDDGTTMGMLCFSNGSLTREKIMKQTCGSWEEYSRSLQQTPPGNNGYMGFYYDTAEIIPRGVNGIWRFDQSDNAVNEFPADVEARAVVELGLADAPKSPSSRILATGGAATNKDILQIIANVFGLPVYTFSQANSAGLGAAYIARWSGHNGYVESCGKVPAPVLVATPDAKTFTLYTELLSRYEKLEQQLKNEV